MDEEEKLYIQQCTCIGFFLYVDGKDFRRIVSH